MLSRSGWSGLVTDIDSSASYPLGTLRESEDGSPGQATAGAKVFRYVKNAEAATAFAVGNNGTALSWNGTTWDLLPTGVDNNLYAIHGVSAVNMWATGNRGMAMQYKAD